MHAREIIQGLGYTLKFGYDQGSVQASQGDRMDDDLKNDIATIRDGLRRETDMAREHLERWVAGFPSSMSTSLTAALLESAIDRQLEYLDEDDIKRFFLKDLARQQEKRKAKLN
jgi:adenylylsulfate kinase-like enzyme